MNEFMYIGIFMGVILVIGIVERIRLQRKIKQVPIRIMVNGIRGKSTVTRLLMGVLKEDQRKVAGKTTGTMPRLIYWDKEEEIEILRSLQGPNISEQKWIVKEVAKRKVDALVTECMAVDPEYQDVFQKRFVRPNITVITNIFEDHLDVMGPTLDQVAEAFSSTIPRNGFLIMPPNPYEEYFRHKAEKRNTKVIIADPDEVTQEEIDRFSYMMFPENVAIGFALADLMWIVRRTALKGMINAPPDPGALVVKTFGDQRQLNYFFNGFAANDATSTITIWERILEEHSHVSRKVIIMNCRHDRVERTIQFAKEVLPELSVDLIIVTGKMVKPVVDAYRNQRLSTKELVILEKSDPMEVVKVLKEQSEPMIVFGIGNIHGGGEEIMEAIESIDWSHKEELSGSVEKKKEKSSKEKNSQRSVSAHVRN